MYAIVEIGGMQFKVDKASTICVPKIELDAGKKINLDRVLLIVDKDKVQIGTPVVTNAVVKATVVSHFKDDKVLVFKKKRRKNYKVLRGHRQNLTKLKIDGISVSKQESKPAAKSAVKKEDKQQKSSAEKKTAKPPVVKKSAAKPAAKKPAETIKKAPVKKTAAKNPATKTAGAKKTAASGKSPKKTSDSSKK